MNSDEKLIAQALRMRRVPVVDEENLIKYRKFLLDRLDKSSILTGREDFPWEEKYRFGPRDSAEYKRLKKTKPSFEDEYQLIDIAEQSADEGGLVAHVTRLPDTKRFQVNLSWLTTRDIQSNDHQPMDDFATWVVKW